MLIKGVKVFFYFYGKKKDQSFENSSYSVDKFTIMVSGLPNKASEIDIEDSFNKYFCKNLVSQVEDYDGENIVIKVNIVYKTAKLMNLQTKQSKLANFISKEKQKNPEKIDKTKLSLKEGEFEKVNEELKKYSNLQNDDQKKLKRKLHTGDCYVTFKSIKIRNLIFESWSRSLIKRIIGKFIRLKYFRGNSIIGTPVTINDAPDPSEILWENIGVSYCQAVFFRYVGPILNFNLLFISFFIVVILNSKKSDIKYDDSKNSIVR